MKEKPNVPAETLAKQAEASDPQNSVWVSANAGSGKTHVLTQRVIRLLLEGTDPSKILCLTYTRAAAANMSNRVFRDLASWTALDDEALAAAIEEIEVRRPGAAKLKLARRLFSKALETPGGLKIQTIHAFCEAILHQFPLEANIAAHFQLLDSQMEGALIAEARRDMISGAADGGDVQLADAFASVLERGGEFGLDKLLDEIVRQRVKLRAFIDRLSGEGGFNYPALFEEFGFSPEETEETIAASLWPLPGFSPSYFGEFRRVALAAGANSVINHILPQASAAFAENDPIDRLELLCQGLLTGKGEPYGERTFTKAIVADLPDVRDRYLDAANAIIETRDTLARWRMVKSTCAMIVIADILIHRYEELKTGRGFLDFTDLITRTVRLLARSDAGAWVQYKLDRGIDHILLDEAQDTSPEQWQVVQSLATEFFAGQGARDDVQRTVFAVGDEKQSIYSFQGADPRGFRESGIAFRQKVTAAERAFRDVRLNRSFRSTQDVLDAVDLVFKDEQNRRGLSEAETPHTTVRDGKPGYVEIWNSIPKEKEGQEDDWREPVDHLTAPAIQLAEQIAETIKLWIGQGDILEGRGTPIVAGDVLVLVRKRDKFVHALSRALKNRGIPIAGADRLRLAAHISVQDMLALGRFLQHSDDDLSLAAVLKSPVFGLTEVELFDVAAGRGKSVSLIAAMRGSRNGQIEKIVAQLDHWRNEAAFKPPFEFYSGVLQRDRVRARMIARLGHEAGDLLDEFLSYCLAYETPGVPGLEAMIATLAESGPEIKREMDQTRGEVRIMTAHASKGLEAPIVFLVDSGSAPVIGQHLPALAPFAGKTALAGAEGFVWNSGAEIKNPALTAILDGIKELVDDEYRRLLYVGMTRAEDRLIVCGYHGLNKQNERSWHVLVKRALEASGNAKPVTIPVVGEVLRFRTTPFDEGSLAAVTAKTQGAESRPALANPATSPSPPRLPRPLSPSGAMALIEPAQPAPTTASPVLDLTGSGTSSAALRGKIMHKLLQLAPDMEPETRSAAMRRYVDAAGADWTSTERDAAVGAVEAILDDARFAPLFSPLSRAEVSIMGMIPVRGHERIVSGQIDRLSETENEVLIVDYKTGRVVPSSLDEAPVEYILQMALYAELLKPIYPGKPIRAALLYTEAPKLVELPNSVLGSALARLTQA